MNRGAPSMSITEADRPEQLWLGDAGDVVIEEV
jgi:hypothetical protein